MSGFTLRRIDASGWQNLALEWEKQSNSFGENFSDHASASMPVLEELASGAQLADAGVYSYDVEGIPQAIAQCNATFLPGYTGKVLRVRHIVLAPRFELDDSLSLEDYGEVLVGIFGGSVLLSVGEMPTEHVKFHLRSPAEQMFGERFKTALLKSPVFTKVDMRGSWIYLSKT